MVIEKKMLILLNVINMISNLFMEFIVSVAQPKETYMLYKTILLETKAGNSLVTIIVVGHNIQIQLSVGDVILLTFYKKKSK